MTAYPCLSTASNQYHSATANSSTSKRTPIHRSVRIREIKRANLFSPKRHVIRQQCNTSKTCSVQQKQKQKQLHWVYCASGSLSLSLPGLPRTFKLWCFVNLKRWKFGNAESEFSFPFRMAQACSRMLEDAQGISSLSSRPAMNCRKFVWMAGLYSPLWVSKIKENNHCGKELYLKKKNNLLLIS